MAVPASVRAAAVLELRRRHNPASFREYVERVNPRFQWYKHNEVVGDVLQRVADDEIRRVMFFEPPRHGKSEQVSRLFSSYYLYRHPERWVGINSYAADLAYTLSRNARDNYVRGGGVLSGSASAVKHWETAAGGGLWAAGVGGPITGKGFHCGIIDDPLKNSEEAASEVVREKQKDWYRSTFYTRQEPGAAIIVVQTRWHEDDLSGWLLDEEGGDEPERWHIVSLPAVAEERPTQVPVTCTLEPDWREEGEALCEERYPLDRLRKFAKRLTAYFWNALFQQRPAPREGNRFKRHWFTFVDASDVPEGGRVIRAWDRASTEGGGDYTAGVRMRYVDGEVYVEDVVRGQWSSARRDDRIMATAQMDGRDVTIWGEEEPGSSGKDQSAAFRKMLMGYKVYTERATGDKETRAEPFAAACEGRHVFIVRGDWNTAYMNELCDFPHGAHDDQVDPSSLAFNKLTLGGRPAQASNVKY